MARSFPLHWKLTLIIAFISISAVALVGVFVRYNTVGEFDRLLRQQTLNNFIAFAADYYQENGSWDGFDQLLRDELPGPLRGARQRLRILRRGLPLHFLLTDADGRAVIRGGSLNIGDAVDSRRLADAIPLQLDNAVIGYVIDQSDTLPLDPNERAYLERTNLALIAALVLIGGLALVAGIFLARMLTRPLRALTAAILAMDKGQLKQKVDIQSEDEIGELARALNQLSANVESANRLREQMTADIAHDLRAPLTVLRGYLESMLDGTLQPNAERLHSMHNEVLYLQRLVEDLRLLSLADAGALKMNRVEILPDDLLNRVYQQFLPVIEQQDLEFRIFVEDDLSPLSVDPDYMLRALSNLVSNAIRYTPPQGVITLSARRQSGGIQIQVEDTGSGIPAEILPRVFERFVRADSSRQAAEGESGLGLAIARSIIEAHGGTIRVESEQGVGTTFIIFLEERPVDRLKSKRGVDAL